MRPYTDLGIGGHVAASMLGALIVFSTCTHADEAREAGEADRIWAQTRIGPSAFECDLRPLRGSDRQRACAFPGAAPGDIQVILLERAQWTVPVAQSALAAKAIETDPYDYWTKALVSLEETVTPCCEDSENPDGRKVRHDYGVVAKEALPPGADLCVRFVYVWQFDSAPLIDKSRGLRCLVIGTPASSAVEIRASVGTFRPVSVPPSDAFEQDAAAVLATLRMD